MKNVYVYSNNFINLLCLIDKLLKENIRPYNIKNKSYNSNLFDNVIELNINEREEIISEFINKYGRDNFKIIYYVFLSNNDKKEIIIFYYLLNFDKYKENLAKIRNLKCVSEALKISSKVSRENHKFKGFTRFRELNNHVLYAEINPDNDILDVLSIHFKNRLSREYWIIKDVNHGKISIYNKKDFYVVSSNEFNLLEVIDSKDEELYKDLWKQFYKTIGICERKNDVCRRNFMPLKYWRYLLEVKDEI